jgi:hypothetical protein
MLRLPQATLEGVRVIVTGRAQGDAELDAERDAEGLPPARSVEPTRDAGVRSWRA